ncbi:hypothetical protein SM0020_19627 [Sinorhizobium meliloti CCNWSX0020]|uniref:Uncharacterized protein n=2 Tax=Sinorhizobium TaxID=28105 RepID=H0G379_RHIML|nr:MULTISPECIES: hypothetical protein [Sinorhizobium]EHK76242.1 hypothetical protein SM0020_19627 [Sinorhizobium meliloti CCNWSX0020]RVE85928.1 hypothetical protein CN238_22805 [Sinorhizobium meliloti]RVH25190.1 hypothetical protein CN214_24095 [Sinorhizobium meliloti]RVH26141.1 hypothetical protein CN211_28955 [Sinorhizobium meliloti]WHS92363.1 hypothetical protein PZL22_003421 [Sinorhizobium kummerowiae]
MRFSELQNLILVMEPPEKRLAKAEGGVEHHMSEAAVMLAFAMHLFKHGAQKVSIQPDGEHGKRFEIQAWLATRGFTWREGWGTTSYAGRYLNGNLVVEVHVKPGQGDVVATIGGHPIVAECKGGIVNTLLTRSGVGEVNIAVAPLTNTTRDLAIKMAPRANRAGINIALVSATGAVEYCGADPFSAEVVALR